MDYSELSTLVKRVLNKAEDHGLTIEVITTALLEVNKCKPTEISQKLINALNEWDIELDDEVDENLFDHD